MSSDRITCPILLPEVDRGWTEYLRAVQGVGLALDLSSDTLMDRLGPLVTRPPEAQGKAALLDAYYRGDGDPRRGLERVVFDRYLGHHALDRLTAQAFVARIHLAAPELSPLALIADYDAPGEPLLLRTEGASAPVLERRVLRRSAALVDPIRGHRLLEARALVDAANELLCALGVPVRFVPLAASLGVEAYFGLDPGSAALLDGTGVLERSLWELRAFARWEVRGESGVPRPRAEDADEAIDGASRRDVA